MTRAGWIKPNRTAFIALLMLVLLSITVQAADETADRTEPEKLRIRHYRPLGDTGLKVSDIGFGAGACSDAAVIEYALELGINYFDTAENYARGSSESAIGEVAAKHRDKMVICTKLYMDGSTTKEDVFNRFEESLKRLQTSYVDVLMIHGGDPGAVANDQVWTALADLKKNGKAHFIGISTHGPEISKVLRPLVEQRKVEVVLCAYDPMTDPDLPAVLKMAKEKGIGLVAMKILSAARRMELAEFRSGSYPFNQAAVRWALMTSGMDTHLVSINLLDQVDEYAAISGAGRSKSSAAEYPEGS